MGRFAGDVAGSLPTSGVTGAVALVGAAGVAVGLGVFTVDAEANPAGTTAAASGHLNVQTRLSDEAIKARHRASEDQVSRSANRPDARRPSSGRPRPSTFRSPSRTSPARVTETVEATDPRDIAMSMLDDYGWSSDQFSCLTPSG